MENLRLIGADILDESERETANKLLEEYGVKIQRALKNVSSIVVHFKKHSKGGKSAKYDIRVRVVAPGNLFEAQESDWDFAKSLHKVFENIEHEVKNTLHTDNQHFKSYG